MKMGHVETEWTQIIRPKGKWLDLRLRELWQYRHLIAMFVRRDFVAGYKQTILGPLWYVIPPLMNSVVLTIVFGNIAALPTDGLPQFLFYMSGVLVWGFFSGAVMGNANIFSTQSGLFSKVYFPRLTVPISNLISGLTSFTLQFLIFLGFLWYYASQSMSVRPGWGALLLPVLLFIMGAMGLGVGIIASAVTTRYRDLSFLIGFGLQLWMYGTPVIYPLSSVPEKYEWLIRANPMTPVVEAFRYAFLGAGTVSPLALLYSLVFSTVLMLMGIMLFNFAERVAMDMI
jgi:lipopolysaccharide transport system permease protein